MLKGLKLMVVLALASVNYVARGQTQPATTSAPARHVLIVPPGFNKITIANHTVLVEPADEPWVRKALETLTPTTRPTTMPADVRDKLQAGKDQLKARMMKDLALTDATEVDRLLNDKLPTALGRLVASSPPMFYMVTTESRLTDLVKNGWTDPRLHYNRLTNKVDIGYATVSADGEADDVLSPMLSMPGDTTETRSRMLGDRIHDSESKINAVLSEQAIIGTDIGISTFIVDQVFTPLKLKHDQEWVGIGLAGVLSSRYSVMLTGMSEQTMIQFNTADSPRNPLRPAMIDLIHPVDLATMRREAMGAYADAYRRKSMRAMLNWVTRAGNDSIPKLITELRKEPLADGKALVQKIQQVSGIDVSADLEAGK